MKFDIKYYLAGKSDMLIVKKSEIINCYNNKLLHGKPKPYIFYVETDGIFFSKTECLNQLSTHSGANSPHFCSPYFFLYRNKFSFSGVDRFSFFLIIFHPPKVL